MIKNVIINCQGFGIQYIKYYSSFAFLGLFRRNHSGEEIGDPYSEDQKRKISATIDKLNILLEKYDKGPVQLEM